MGRGVSLKQLAFSFFLLAFISGCGSSSPDKSAGNTRSGTPVILNLSTPSERAGKLKSLNAPSGPIASIKVEVTGDDEVLASETAAVLPEDLLIKMTLEIAPGLDRTFSVTALDALGELHSEGQATVAIEASKKGSPPQVVTIVMKAVQGPVVPPPDPPPPLAKTLTVRVVGLIKETDPIPGVRVLLHHPTTGALITERLTDVNGVADFGDIEVLFGLTRASFTVQGVGNSLFSAVNVLPGAYTVTDGPVVGVSLAQATFDVTATPPAGTSNVEVQVGHFEDFDGIPFPVIFGPATATATAPNRQAVALKPGGTFDLFAFGRDFGGSVNFCGYKDGLVPSEVDGIPQPITVGTPPVNIPFVADGNVLVDVEVLRSGSIFGTGAPVGPGTTTGFVPVCDDPKINHYDVVVETPFPGTGLTQLGIDLVFDRLPVAADLNNIILPKLSIDTLTRNFATQTFNWVASGADIAAIDLANMQIFWTDTGPSTLGPVEWEVWVAPTDGSGPPESPGGSFVLPQLPLDPLGTPDPFPAMPPAAIDFDLALIGIESPGVGTVGYDASINLLNANAFNPEKTLLSSTTQVIFAFRTE